MESKTQNSQHHNEGEQSQRTNKLQNLLSSQSNQDNVVLAK